MEPGQKTKFTLNRFRPWSAKPFETVELWNCGTTQKENRPVNSATGRVAEFHPTAADCSGGSPPVNAPAGAAGYDSSIAAACVESSGYLRDDKEPSESVLPEKE